MNFKLIFNSIDAYTNQRLGSEMINLQLYSTSHCHLCEEAEAILKSLSKQYEIQWVSTEITNSNALLDKYGTKIPVVAKVDTNKEIQWPFSLFELEQFILNNNA